jgi:hypothetical protein
MVGICLSMAAALFPAAISENERSVHNSVGSRLGGNGLAAVRARLEDEKGIDLHGLTDVFQPVPVYNSGDAISGLGPNNYRIKEHVGDSRMSAGDKQISGYVPLIRDPDDGLDGYYELLAIAWTKQNRQNDIYIAYPGGDYLQPDDNFGPRIQVVGDHHAAFVMETPVIVAGGPYGGRHAEVIGRELIDEGTNTWFIYLDGELADADFNENYVVVLEYNSDNAALLPNSPAISVSAMRTALRGGM